MPTLRGAALAQAEIMPTGIEIARATASTPPRLVRAVIKAGLPFCRVWAPGAL